MFKEIDRSTRFARSEGKKVAKFDCYGVARTGFVTRTIELMFAQEPDESERDTYEEAVEKENA
jgi:hypothetical protein